MTYAHEAHKRRIFSTRVDVETPDIVDAIAKELGYLRIDGSGIVQGSAGVMLDKIAQGYLKIVPVSEVE